MEERQLQRKRKRKGDPFKEAYENVTIVPRESTGRPGSPHCFFNASYEVVGSEDKVVIQQHANGLCIVTVGKSRPNVKHVEFLVEEAPESSAGERRKRQSKLLRGDKLADTQGLVSPNTILVRLELENGETEDIPAGVWGTVLELNPRLTPELLRDDPLLDGYLAVILPTGSFPPRFRHDGDTDKNNTEAAERSSKEAATVEPDSKDVETS